MKKNLSLLEKNSKLYHFTVENKKQKIIDD